MSRFWDFLRALLSALQYVLQLAFVTLLLTLPLLEGLTVLSTMIDTGGGFFADYFARSCLCFAI